MRVSVGALLTAAQRCRRAAAAAACTGQDPLLYHESPLSQVFDKHALLREWHNYQLQANKAISCIRNAQVERCASA